MQPNPSKPIVPGCLVMVKRGKYACMSGTAVRLLPEDTLVTVVNHGLDGRLREPMWIVDLFNVSAPAPIAFHPKDLMRLDDPDEEELRVLENEQPLWDLMYRQSERRRCMKR